MKKTTFLAVVLMSAALISGRSYAQGSKYGTKLVIAQPINTPATTSPDPSPAPATAVSKINLRAIKDFKSRFTNIADEQWSRIADGFSATCTKDGFKMRIYYGLRGNWQGSVKYCDESQLPHLIRDVVKRTYYDLAITFVNIVEVPDHLVYLVHLEDKKNLKIVRVTEDGDMDVLNEFEKSN